MLFLFSFIAIVIANVIKFNINSIYVFTYLLENSFAIIWATFVLFNINSIYVELMLIEMNSIRIWIDHCIAIIIKNRHKKNILNDQMRIIRF